MTETDSGSSGRPQPAPADAFDLIGDLQRRAADQAGSIVGRLIHAFEPDGEHDRLSSGDPPATDPSFAHLRAAFGRAVDLSVDLFLRTAESYMDMMEVAMRRRGLSVTASDGGGIHLEHHGDATTVEGTLYVHNYSGAAATPPTVLVTDLTAADGSVVPASRIRVGLPAEGAIDDRSTVPVGVVVEVDGAAPGVYHGHVLSGEDAVGIRLTVTAP